jgi:hypothetical protein
VIRYITTYIASSLLSATASIYLKQNRQGVLVVAAAGNSGDDGLWTYGSPASEPDSFAVGSTDNAYSLGAVLVLDTSIAVRGQATKALGEQPAWHVHCALRALLCSRLSVRSMTPDPVCKVSHKWYNNVSSRCCVSCNLHACACSVSYNSECGDLPCLAAHAAATARALMQNPVFNLTKELCNMCYV